MTKSQLACLSPCPPTHRSGCSLAVVLLYGAVEPVAEPRVRDLVQTLANVGALMF